MIPITLDNTMLVLALKSINDCVCITDLADNILFINESFLRTYGYSEEELIGKPLDIVRSDNISPEIVSGIIPATLHGGWRGELVNRRKDGSELIVNIVTSVIRDDQGNPTAFMGIATDITETKRMQSKVRMVTELFHSLGQNSARNIATIVSCACNILDGAASLYNRLNESNSSLVIWAGHNLPADMPLEDGPAGHICYEATINEQQPVMIADLTQTTYMHSDPNVARYGLKSYLGYPVMRRGRIIGSLAVVDNVVREFKPQEIDLLGILARALTLEEDRQDTQSLLEAAIQQSPSGILIADAPEVKIRFANSKALKILQGKSDQEPAVIANEIIWTWEAFKLDGTHVSRDLLPLTRAIIGGEITENEEYIIHAGDGEKRYISVNAAPVRNQEKVITAGIVTFHDVTSRHKAESELQLKVEELERFNHLMLGRELKMIELKKEINDLLFAAGGQEKYIVHE